MSEQTESIRYATTEEAEAALQWVLENYGPLLEKLGKEEKGRTNE